MKLRHILILSLCSFLPVFVFAAATTTAGRTVEEDQLIKGLQDQVSNLLSPKNIRQNAIAEYLKVSTSPQSPKPGETVRVTIESYLSDLSKATITWSVNNKVIEKGIDKTSFSFKVGPSGGSTRLGILIVTNEGEEVYKEYSFNPLGLTILWEADTYTPPFYKGKPLATYQSRVRAVVIPDAVKTSGAFDTSTLSYTWKQNGYAVSEASGYGKNSYTFTAPRPYEETRVNVSASPLKGGSRSEFALSLPIANPFILFYKVHPLLGVRYERPLGSEVTLSEKDISLRAEPFFFSNGKNEAGAISYTWVLNGKTIVNPGRAITLQNTEGVKGESQLSLGMYGIKKTFQSASQVIRLKFNDESVTTPTF